MQRWGLILVMTNDNHPPKGEQKSKRGVEGAGLCGGRRGETRDQWSGVEGAGVALRLCLLSRAFLVPPAEAARGRDVSTFWQAPDEGGGGMDLMQAPLHSIK